jgi:ATPase subunit of ABC transporter with duplicated ATPase domains
LLFRDVEFKVASGQRVALIGAIGVAFDKLSGGQQARLQILLLELRGSTLLALDEPTDNLAVASAEALEHALAAYAGTVEAVSHDRWFLHSFERFFEFGKDGTVAELDHAA